MRKDFFIRPLDSLFFRDGRPFGEASRSSSGLPTPQTLYGAVITSILLHFKVDFQKLGSFPSTLEALKNIVPNAPWISDIKIHGPWIAQKESDACKLYYNAPSVLLKSKKESDKQCFSSLPKKASEIPGWNSPEGLRPLWTVKVSSEMASGYLSHNTMAKFLNGTTIGNDEIVEPHKIFSYQSRTGIGIDADTNVTQKSIIYAANHLCMKEDFGFAFSLELPESADSLPNDVFKLLSWGGESRKVLLEPIPNITHPEVNIKPGFKPFVVLSTPAMFNSEKPWKPECFQKSLCAASVPSSICVSGWDFRTRGPKLSRFGVPSGSTFFLEDESEIPSTGSLCNQETALSGWGCFLKGAWKDE